MLFDAVDVKLIFDGHGSAKKVQYIQNGQLYEAKTRKAIVLAGGINSSKLLQLSGIGPAEVLKNAGIKPVFINENVGKHLQNHPLIFITLLANPLANGVPLGGEYSFTINSVYLPVVGGSASDPRMLQILFEYVPNTATTPALVLIGFELLNPVSEGSVNILSDNPFQLAAADDGFYQNPVDLENMKNAVKVYIRDLLLQLSTLDPPYYQPLIIDPIIGVILQGYSDQSVQDYVKNNSNLSLDVHHFTSHCKMAPLSAGGVVDGDTRVYGTKNVFVADDSICPVIPDINTAASAMMIGLRSSEIIKQALKK
jgi:choline dehydrogenase